jgi:putative membrane protein
MNRKTSTLLSLGISVALLAAGIWFLYNSQHRFGYGNGRWAMPYHMAAGGGGMGIIMILFWVALLSAIALVISAVISSYHSSGSSNSDALEILRQRYARGEIDKIEFEQMKHDLQ